MTLSQLKEKIREILPDARFDRNRDGEIVIYTDKMIEDTDRDDRENRQIVPFEPRYL